MKTTIPLLIVAVTGCLMIAAKFIPPLSVWKNEAGGWFEILAGLAFVVGGANLCAQHLKKISARRAGWGYSAVTLASFTVTLFVGLLKVGVTSDNPDYPW